MSASIAYAIAELHPCPALNDTQRAKGVTCARYANGSECFGGFGGKCSEGGAWHITDKRIAPAESVFETFTAGDGQRSIRGRTDLYEIVKDLP